MRTSLRIAIAVIAVTAVVGGVLITRTALISAPLPLPAPANSHQAQPLSSTGQYVFEANSGHVTQGVRYQFRLYTHCGLNGPTGPDFDGSFWTSVGPGDDGSGNPPAGFGNPFDIGTMTLVSANVAEYRSSSGASVRFTRQASTKSAGLCS
jgi:hypothetical protein